ncbi:MAG: NAD-dependent epimerase/dehydratase family protein [Microbacterium gubbeenense]|uniref:NAD-dependent epimerase/dehydratase family protein n=1 Tax=Microbacterium gubbeenense TaxID=159896 RepID=UPI003F9D4EBD
MSRVVVTGGAGRLGRSVVAVLAAAGHEVTSFDQGHVDGLPATQVSVDLIDPQATADAFAAVRPDSVVHLAAIAVPGALPDPEMFRVNTQLVWSVLEAALAAGAEKLLLASSPTVMGYGSPGGWEPKYLPLDEEHPIAPWNGYGTSKVAMEQIVQMAVRQHGSRMRFGTFRPCFVISPEEWLGGPTQQGHTLEERLADPSLAAVSLFNYIDARDAGEFVDAWLARANDVPNGSTFFVSAPDALYDGETADGIREHVPAAARAAERLTGTQAAFSSARAEALLGWRASRLWRDCLVRAGESS